MWSIAEDGEVNLSRSCSRLGGGSASVCVSPSPAAEQGLNFDDKVGLLLLGACDVSEVYSPPRFTAQAPAAGLRGGFAVDLSTQR